MRGYAFARRLLAISCIAMCAINMPRALRLRMVRVCPKKGVWNFQALNRQFYSQPPNLEGAHRFLDERLGRCELVSNREPGYLAD